MDFFTLLILSLLLTVAAELLRPKPKFPTPEAGDLTPPQAEEGGAIPVVWGTCKVAPTVVWFGDVQVTPITKKVKTGLFSSTQVTTGYEYAAGMQLVICHGPIDELQEIYFGDYRLTEARPIERPSYAFRVAAAERGTDAPILPPLPLPYTDQVTRASIYAPGLFGGPEHEGGVSGDVDIHWGSQNQGPNDYLALFFTPDRTSQYRGLCFAVLRRFGFGRSPYIKPMWAVVRRCPDTLGQPATSNIYGDANPAHAIYEVLTNTLWGLGMDPADIDLASFQAAATTLAAEGVGISLILRSATSAEELVRTLVRYADGVIFPHPVGGLLTLKLIRADYNVATLTRITPQNARGLDFTRGSWAETVNEVKLRYTDGERRFQPAIAPAQNLAAIQATGGVRTRTEDFPGFSKPAVAQERVEKLVRVSSVPLARASLTANRVAGLLTLGEPFVLAWPPLGIDELVMRVLKAGYGQLPDGAVEIDAVEDVFDLSGIAYGIPNENALGAACGPLALILPGGDPTSLQAEFGPGDQVLLEAPYWHVGERRRVYALVSRSKNADVGWELWRSERGLAYVQGADQTVFTPVGLLAADYPATTAATDEVGFVVRNAGDLQTLTGTDAAGLLAGSRLALVGSEIVSWRAVTDLGDGTYRMVGVMRGVLDTVPEYHAVGTRVFFYRPAAFVDVSSADYAADLTVRVKPLRADAAGIDTLEQSTAAEVATRSRAFAPRPPGNVKLNGAGYAAWPAVVTGDATLSWSQRARSQGTLTAQDNATSEALEGTITVEALIAGKVARSWVGLVGTSQVYTAAQRQGDDPDASKPVAFRITPVSAGGVAGTVRTTPAFVMQ